MNTTLTSSTPQPDLLAQAVATILLARVQGGFAADIAARRYGARSIITRAMIASSGAEGGFLVPSELYAGQIIDSLRSLAVGRRPTPPENILPMPHGNLSLGRANTSAQVGWIGEDIATQIARAPQFGDVSLMAKKAIAILPVSNSLIRYSDPRIEATLTDGLLRQFASVEDAAFLTGDGTQFSPKGIFWRAKTTLEATQAYNISTVIQDLERLLAALQTANVPMLKPTWFMHPKVRDYLTTVTGPVGSFQFPDMSEGRLFGFPVAVTTNMPSDLGVNNNESEVYLVDMDSFLIGQAYLEIQIISNGTYHDAQGNLASAFDRDESLIKLVAGVDCALRHNQAAAVLTSVPWGN